MNPLLHQLVRQHEAELRERTAEVRHRHDLPRTRPRARFTSALLAVVARTRRRHERVTAQIPTAPVGCPDVPPPADIRVIRQDRPGRALAWRNAACADEEPLASARDRDRDLPRQADVGYPLTFIEIPAERCDE
jgi:hypothetical protein